MWYRAVILLPSDTHDIPAALRTILTPFEIDCGTDDTGGAA